MRIWSPATNSGAGSGFGDGFEGFGVQGSGVQKLGAEGFGLEVRSIGVKKMLGGWLFSSTAKMLQDGQERMLSHYVRLILGVAVSEQ